MKRLCKLSIALSSILHFMQMKSFFSYIGWLISKIWGAIIIPFLTFWNKRYLIRSFLWLVFTIGLSLIGTIINVIKVAFFNIPEIDSNYSFADRVMYSIYQDCQSGTFYTFSIVLAASILYPLFEGFLKHEFNYINLRVLTIIAALLLLAFGGVFYSFSSVGYSHNVTISQADLRMDWYQFGFFVVAIMVASYSFSIGLLVEDKEHPHPEIDDYADADSQAVENLKDKVREPIEANGDLKI